MREHDLFRCHGIVAMIRRERGYVPNFVYAFPQSYSSQVVRTCTIIKDFIIMTERVEQNENNPEL